MLKIEFTKRKFYFLYFYLSGIVVDNYDLDFYGVVGEEWFYTFGPFH